MYKLLFTFTKLNFYSIVLRIGPPPFAKKLIFLIQIVILFAPRPHYEDMKYIKNTNLLAKIIDHKIDTPLCPSHTETAF